MRVVSWRAIREFMAAGNARGEAALTDWYDSVEEVPWTKFSDVRATFAKTDRIVVASGKDVYVFNVGGGRLRIIAGIHFNKGLVFILRVLTHAEYDKNEWKKNL